MILRAEFLKSLALLVPAVATPSPSPAPSESPSEWDMCTQSPVLPYDRPLGLKMRVLDGPDFDLADYRGKAVLLNIFATWCGPCQFEQPFLVNAHEAYSEKGLSIVGVDAREPDDTVRAYRKKYGIQYPIAMDSSGKFVLALENGDTSRTAHYPTTLFIDPKGYLYCDRVGAMEEDEFAYRLKAFMQASFPPA